MTAPELRHLATPDEWAAYQDAGSIQPPSLRDEGFVHCSTDAQVDATIERHYADVDELIVLHLHADGLRDALRWEEGRPGEPFPHVYRAIEIAEVARAVPWHRPPRGW